MYVMRSYNVIENDKLECCQIAAIAVLWQIAVADFLAIVMASFGRMVAPILLLIADFVENIGFFNSSTLQCCSCY
jgi:hypothetical protein